MKVGQNQEQWCDIEKIESCISSLASMNVQYMMKGLSGSEIYDQNVILKIIMMNKTIVVPL